MGSKRRSDMSPAERRLDLYKLLAFIVAIALFYVGVANDVDLLPALAGIILGVTNIATEVIRARRFGHALLNRWIPQREAEPRA